MCFLDNYDIYLEANVPNCFGWKETLMDFAPISINTLGKKSFQTNDYQSHASSCNCCVFAMKI